LLDCVHHARTFHKLAWAQTAIELTAEHCWQNKCVFLWKGGLLKKEAYINQL